MKKGGGEGELVSGKPEKVYPSKGVRAAVWLLCKQFFHHNFDHMLDLTHKMN